MDLGRWLRSLGLERYEPAFRENEIDETVLPNLTADDLKELGVVALGHRRKLIDAIAALRSNANVSAAAVSVDGGAVEASSRDAAERRQVTVMFSDLVGSTALAARMDPEDLREVIAAYQKCVAETVARFGGFVAKYMGDGVLVYFGYPQAHEDDAERAVRAGLELVAAIAALKARTILQTRVGIATGLVVIGDIVGTGEAQERGIVGETPNLAARLQGAAEPDMVVIAESTRKLIGNLFDLEELGAKTLKGISEPVPAYAALRPSAVESRFEALRGSGLTDLVGRGEELELLLRCWTKAKAAEGQVVLLSGEAGIGKSRLSAALLEEVAAEPHIRLRYFCSPQHTDSALYPIIAQMQRAAGFAHGDGPQAKRDKLDALLGQSSTSAQDAGLLAEMLSLPNEGRYPAPALDPQQRRKKTFEALTAQVEMLSRQRPVLMIFEDAHWADPTSLEVLNRVLDRIKTLAVLLLVSFRPEFQAPWIGRPYVTTLTINRLVERDIKALIGALVGNKPLPANVRQDIIERADGIPLFVEEMTKAVLEAGGEEAAARTVAAIPSPAAAVPPSLHASLMARLDRLGPAKEVAQVGAAIGREFSHTLLTAIARKPERELDAALARLVDAGLLFRYGTPPNASYVFKHALVQDAAYGTLLREPRRALHARIVESIEAKFSEIAESQPELLARHCAEAGLTEKAAILWGRAGQRSQARSALVEAAEQLNRALALIMMLPGTPALRREEIKLQATLITPLIYVKGHAAAETTAAVERAGLLIEQAEARGEPPEDPLILFQVLYGAAVARFVAFDGKAIGDLAAQFLALAEKQKQTIALVAGHLLVGNGLLCTGNPLDARPHYTEGLALYDRAEHRRYAAHFGQDARVGLLFYRSLALWLLGYPEMSRADLEQAIRKGHENDQAATLIYALGNGASQVLVWRGDYAGANRVIDELFALATERGSVFYQICARLWRAHLLALTGEAAPAVEIYTADIPAYRATGGTVWLPWILSVLAYAHAQLGQFADAWRCVDESRTLMERTGERRLEAETLRLSGEIALLEPTPGTAKAEAYFERALGVARRQQAKSWELRAATSMARLWRGQGKRDKARDLLAPVYGWFTEGFDTLDLKEARVLLDELAA